MRSEADGEAKEEIGRGQMARVLDPGVWTESSSNGMTLMGFKQHKHWIQSVNQIILVAVGRLLGTRNDLGVISMVVVPNSMGGAVTIWGREEAPECIFVTVSIEKEGRARLSFHPVLSRFYDATQLSKLCFTALICIMIMTVMIMTKYLLLLSYRHSS